MQNNFPELEKLKKMSVRELFEHYHTEWITEQTTLLTKEATKKIKDLENKKAADLNKEDINSTKKSEITTQYDDSIKEVEETLKKSIERLNSGDKQQAFATKSIIENKYGISIQGQYPKAVFEKVQHFLNWYPLKSIGMDGQVASNEQHVKLYESYNPIDNARQFQRSKKDSFWYAWLWLTISIMALIFLTFTWIPQWCETGNVHETWTIIWQIVSFIAIFILPFLLGCVASFKTWYNSIPDSGIGAEKFAEIFTHNAVKNALLLNTQSGKYTKIAFPYSSSQAMIDRQLMHDHQQPVHVYAHEGSFEIIDFPLVKVPTQELVNSWHPLYYLEEKEWVYFYAGLDDSLQLGVKEYLVTGLDQVYHEQRLVQKANTHKANGLFDVQLTDINAALSTLTEIINTKWNNNTEQANHKLVSTCSYMSIIFQYLFRNILRVITLQHNANTRVNEEKVNEYALLKDKILQEHVSILSKLFDLEIAIDAIHQYDPQKEAKIVSLFEEFMQTNNVLASAEQLSKDAEHLDMISGSKEELKRLVLESLEEKLVIPEKVLVE